MAKPGSRPGALGDAGKDRHPSWTGQRSATGRAIQTARVLTDKNTSLGQKAAEGAATAAEVAATAIVTSAGAPIAGKAAGAVAGKIVRSKTAKKLSKPLAACLVVLMIIPVAIALITAAMAGQAASMLIDMEPDQPTTLDPCTVTVGTSSALTTEQQRVASDVLAEVTARGLRPEDGIIAIMTGLTESGLRSLEYGDNVGPDSRGVFQQRDPWGSLADRLDPRKATGLFLNALTSKNLRVYGTTQLVNETSTSRYEIEPWLVAQSVQRSAFSDGSNYKAKYAQAVQVVTDMLSAATTAGVDATRWGAPSIETAAGPTQDTRDGTSANGDGEADAEGAAGGTIGGADGVGAVPVSGACGTFPSTGAAGSWGGHQNGQIPDSAMCPIPFAAGQQLRCDAVEALVAMNEDYAARFSSNIAVTDSYRSLQDQVATKAAKGWLAAEPGTSNHGWALALDLGGGINSFGTSQHTWLQQNADRFGWVHPAWAQAGGAKPEPWHWEFTGTQQVAASS